MKNNLAAIFIFCLFSYTTITALPIHDAVIAGNLANVQQELALLNHPNVVDEGNNDESPLGLAVIHGHKDIVGHLIGRADIEIDAINRDGETALLLSLIHIHDRFHLNDRYDIFNTLWNAGADGDHQGGGYFPLLIASEKGLENIVNRLLEIPAGENEPEVDVNQTGIWGKSSLFVAAENGHSNIVRKLLNAGAQARIDRRNERGYTPLMIAAVNGHREVVNELLDQRADLHLRLGGVFGGPNAADLAAGAGHAAIVQRLRNAALEIR